METRAMWKCHPGLHWIEVIFPNEQHKLAIFPTIIALSKTGSLAGKQTNIFIKTN